MPTIESTLLSAGRMTRIFIGSAVAVILFLGACSNISADKKSEVKIDPYWNELSMFLAGMPVGKESRLWEKSQKSFYKGHIASMDEFWKKVQSDTIEIIGAWRKTNIPAGIEKNGAFYPLSGSDFVNFYSLFPGARRYLMVAMEDPGEIPDPMALDDRSLDSGLSSIRKTTLLYGKLNYFQTRVMIKEMRNLNIKGATPILMIFLSRMGHRVVNIQRIGIDTDGKPAGLDSAGLLKGAKPKYPGVSITFQAPGETATRELIYLSMMLDKDTVNPQSPTGIFFGTYLSGVSTMIKAGCYIFFIDKFRDVMDFILARSNFIVQDDSGIPYRAYRSDLWDMKLYGVYVPNYPITDTAIYKQEDLMKVYRGGGILPLPFNFGYGSLLGKDKSNLMMARKKEQK